MVSQFVALKIIKWISDRSWKFWDKTSKIFIQKCSLHSHKKNRIFLAFRFSLKVARQLPLNTPKNLNRKTHLRSVIFWNSAEISPVFCQCTRSLQSRRDYSGFWSRDTWPSGESPADGRISRANYKIVRCMYTALSCSCITHAHTLLLRSSLTNYCISS